MTADRSGDRSAAGSGLGERLTRASRLQNQLTRTPPSQWKGRHDLQPALDRVDGQEYSVARKRNERGREQGSRFWILLPKKLRRAAPGCSRPPPGSRLGLGDCRAPSRRSPPGRRNQTGNFLVGSQSWQRARRNPGEIRQATFWWDLRAGSEPGEILAKSDRQLSGGRLLAGRSPGGAAGSLPASIPGRPEGSGASPPCPAGPACGTAADPAAGSSCVCSRPWVS